MLKLNKKCEIKKLYSHQNSENMTINVDTDNFDNKECKLYRKKLKKLNHRLKLGKVLAVELRQNGLTSTGRKLQCHLNVKALVKRYGGSRIQGYLIKTTKTANGKAIEFTHHSVWRTPENKLVDVTDNSSAWSNSLYLEQNGKKYSRFIPVYENKNVVNKRFGHLAELVLINDIVYISPDENYNVLTTVDEVSFNNIACVCDDKPSSEITNVDTQFSTSKVA